MNARLNQKQLADLLYNASGLSRNKSEQFVKNFFEIIEDELLKGEQVKIKGLGVFKTVKIEERESVNVNTGERIVIDGYIKPSFTPDSALKDLINKPFASFESMVLSDFQAEMISSSIDSSEDNDNTIDDETTIDEESVVIEQSVEEKAEIEEITIEEPETVKEEEENAVDEQLSDTEQITEVPEAEKAISAEVEAEATAEPEPVEEVEATVEPETIEEVEATVEPEPVEESEPVEVAEPIAEPEFEQEVAEETISEQESEEIAEELEPAGEPEPIGEPAGEPEPIEEPVSTTTISSERIDNKNVISKSKRNALRVLVWIFSLVLVVLLALYMLYPVIIQQYMKWQYNSLKSDDNTEIVVEKVQENIAESVTEDDNVQTDDVVAEKVSENEIRTISEVSAEDITRGDPSEIKFRLNSADERKDLADFTVKDTVNYEIVGTLAEHTLKKNEILTVLSEKYYGTKKLWPYIVKYNNFEDFNKLYPGMKVKIPRLKNK
ncbi:MAG: HU family DNA-binding protein [Bacteroidaceae bacterium]|nr:HU family DNA-binding protein [Bacteroidaceae bacterium]